MIDCRMSTDIDAALRKDQWVTSQESGRGSATKQVTESICINLLTSITRL